MLIFSPSECTDSLHARKEAEGVSVARGVGDHIRPTRKKERNKEKKKKETETDVVAVCSPP